MNKFDELFEKLSALTITQKSGDWEEDLPDEIWTEYFEGNFDLMASGLSVSTHRWYETSIDVIKIYNELLGIRYLTNSFSESQDIEDCYVQIQFYKMQPKTIVTYEIIK